jgi:hypothetical protein
MSGCGKIGHELMDMQTLVVALQAKYDLPVKVTLNNTGVLRVAMTHATAIDTVKFTRAACGDYADGVARFAIDHYSERAALTAVQVDVIEARDYGLAHTTETYCTGTATPTH